MLSIWQNSTVLSNTSRKAYSNLDNIGSVTVYLKLNNSVAKGPDLASTQWQSPQWYTLGHQQTG